MFLSLSILLQMQGFIPFVASNVPLQMCYIFIQQENMHSTFYSFTYTFVDTSSLVLPQLLFSACRYDFNTSISTSVDMNARAGWLVSLKDTLELFLGFVDDCTDVYSHWQCVRRSLSPQPCLFRHYASDFHESISRKFSMLR